jgi:hypothetical protein
MRSGTYVRRAKLLRPTNKTRAETAEPNELPKENYKTHDGSHEITVGPLVQDQLE